MVLSLFTSRTAYYAGQYPAFQIDAVSTASRTCSFDISPHRLHVQVVSKGRVIWDSADCSRGEPNRSVQFRRGEPNRSVQFRRGVPAEASVTWRRIVSLPGCVTVASSARPGSYPPGQLPGAGEGLLGGQPRSFLQARALAGLGRRPGPAAPGQAGR
jgi:hypothetical protein